MSGHTVVKQDRRRFVTITVTAVAVGLLAVLALWARWSGDAVSPRIVEGWAMPNASGTAVSLHQSPEDTSGEGYVIAGARWRGIDNVWHEGSDIPTCVGNDTGSFSHVMLGLITVETPDGGVWDQVTWLECVDVPLPS